MESTAPAAAPTTSKFTVQAVLFDMDGTLTDSIAAVEAAWTAKAEELGLDPDEVIAATHGRRAEDNLLELVPNLKREDIHREVESEHFRCADAPFLCSLSNTRRIREIHPAVCRHAPLALAPLFHRFAPIIPRRLPERHPRPEQQH